MDDTSEDEIQRHGRKRKRSVDDLDYISGQLTARSHILHSQPPSILIEICSEDSIEYIINEHRKTFMLANNLCVGKFYEFLNLERVTIQLKTRALKCFRFTSDTTWEEIEPMDNSFQTPALADVFTIPVEVTRVDSDFGICYIDNSRKVIVSSCSRIALHHMPKAGEEVTFTNVHRITSQDDEVLFVLCARSFISFTGENMTSIPTLNLSPLMLALGDSVRDYRLILWLQECLSLLKTSLSDEFLKSEAICLQRHKNFHFTLLINLAKSALSRISPCKVSLLEEFVSTDHESTCGALHESKIPYLLLNLAEANDENPNLENELDETGLPMYWQYDVKKDQKRFLVGLISMRNSTHRLSLSDASCAINCLVLPAEGQTAIAEALAKLNKCVILAWDHDILTEQFCSNASEPTGTSQTFKSFALYLDKTKLFHSSSRNELDVYTYDKERNMFSIESKKRSLDKHLVMPQTSSQGFQSASAMSEFTCITKQKGTPLQHYLSQYIIVQSKSSIIAPLFELNARKPARSYILVSLLGQTVSSKHTISRGKNVSMHVFLGLEKSMLQVHPFLCVNTVYEIRIPVEHDGFFKRGAPLKQLEGLVKMLPTINCVTLLDSFEIFTAPNVSIPTNSLVSQDIYSIDQAVREANPKELINIVGYITGRFHQEPKYDREKISSKAHGFGVPGSKIIALTLRDTPPQSRTGSPATLYLTNMTQTQYPIGLVPGAKVLFRFVMKHIPQSSAQTTLPYFRASVLTSVEILELADSAIKDSEQSKKYLWGPRSLLHSAVDKKSHGCQWISVSMTQLHSISLSAECSSCRHPIKNSECDFVGCSATESTIYSKAAFILQEFECQSAFVLLPHALVPKLFQGSDKLWNMLEKLTGVHGQLVFNRSASKETLSQLSKEDKVFRVLCRRIMSAQRFHLLCREFNNKSNRTSCDLPTLYAVDISPITMLMASS